MDRATATRRLRKMLGPKFEWRVYREPSSPDRREAALLKAAALRTERESLKRRKAEIIAAIPEVQQIDARLRETFRPLEEARANSVYYRFMVGIGNGLGVVVKAYGDSWEDIFRSLAVTHNPDKEGPK